MAIASAPGLSVVAAVLSGLVLVSCTAPFRCPDGDWRRAGYRDAMAGYGADAVRRYARTCAAAPGDAERAAWASGHAEGTAAYCTAGHAWRMGRERGSFNPGLCPDADRARLAGAHHRGRVEREMLDDLRRGPQGRLLPRF